MPLSPPLAGALLPDELAPELVFELALEVAAALLEELDELIDLPPPVAVSELPAEPAAF